MRRWKVLAAATAIVAAVGAGIAWASIPDLGVIHACYKNANGDLRVIDTATSVCKVGETALDWNQTGPPGATNVVIRTETQTVAPGSSHTFTAHCDPGEKATGGGWRMEGPLPAAAPPITVLGIVPQSSSSEPSAGETPIAWKVVGAANHDVVDHDVTVFAVCSSP